MPFNFDIDKYLNRVVPRPRLYAIPYPVARFLGYRRSHEHDHKIKDATGWMWSFLGAFVGLIILEQVFLNINGRLKELEVPMVVGSFGATAILVYNSIDAPLSQPRNVILGQVLSAIIGVGVTKLFMLNSNFDDIVWLSGAMCCGIASAIMGITKTVHPPAGATALLASSEPALRRLGWWYIPVVLLSSVLMLAVALLFNNIQRRYPQYWWTPVSLEKPQAKEHREHAEGSALEKQISHFSTVGTFTATDRNEMVLTGADLRMPDWLRESLGEEQLMVLEEIRSLLHEEQAGLRDKKPGHGENSNLGTQNGSHNTLVESPQRPV